MLICRNKIKMSYNITMSQEELEIFRSLIQKSSFGQYITVVSIEKGRRLYDVRIDVDYVDFPFNLLANFFIKVGEVKSLNRIEDEIQRN